MRAILLATAFASIVVLGAPLARAADADKPTAAAKTPAPAEVTLTGDMVCAKCVLKESKTCQNVLRVTEGDKETKYYLTPNALAKANHSKVCGATAKATVTGTVKEKGGKKLLTASAIKVE